MGQILLHKIGENCETPDKLPGYDSEGNQTCKCAGGCVECNCTNNDEQPLTSIIGEGADKVIIQIFRNRSEMECTVIDSETGAILYDRLPVEWKSRENKLDYLSVSKISAYEQCPACFYQQYMAEETAQVDNSNFYTRFGSILHAVVEKASLYYMESGIIVNPVQIYDEVWKSYNLSDFPAYIEGKNLIISYFANNPIDKRTDTTLFVEREWRGELGGCTFGLMLDYAGVMKNDPTTGILKDYKTNRMAFTPSELETSFQLKIYEIVLRRFLVPEIKNWISGYEMFRFGWQQCPPRTAKDLDDAEQYIANTWHQITHDNVWEEKLNNYCGYRTCRLTCKTYQDYVKDPKKYVDAFNVENIDYDEIDKQKDTLAAYEKIAKTRKEECNDILKTAVEKSIIAGEKFIVNGSELQLFAQAKQSYNYYDTKNVLLANNRLDLLEGCLSIGKAKFDKSVSTDPRLQLQLASCLSTNYSSPYIIKKKC